MITNIDRGDDEADEVGGGRTEALAGQLVRRQAPTEEDDDRQQRTAHRQRCRLRGGLDNLVVVGSLIATTTR